MDGAPSGSRLVRVNGRIYDEAVASPIRLTDPATSHRLLELTPSVPTPVWGRDKLRTGDMWNSNSVVSWLVARAGLPVDECAAPAVRNGSGLEGWNRSGARSPVALRGRVLLDHGLRDAESPRILDEVPHLVFVDRREIDVRPVVAHVVLARE